MSDLERSEGSVQSGQSEGSERYVWNPGGPQSGTQTPAPDPGGSDGTGRSLAGRIVRGLLIATGVVVLAIGLLVAFVPELEGLLPVDRAIAALGSDYVVVAVVGLVAVALALLAVGVRRLGGVDEATPPEVESVPTASYPGESFDRVTGGLAARFGDAGDTRRRLRHSAVRAVARAENCSRSAAERLVDEGTWTDDAVAARYVSRSASASGPLGSDGDAARRAAEAIVRLCEGGEASTDARRDGTIGAAGDPGTDGSDDASVVHGSTDDAAPTPTAHADADARPTGRVDGSNRSAGSAPRGRRTGDARRRTERERSRREHGAGGP